MAISRDSPGQAEAAAPALLDAVVMLHPADKDQLPTPDQCQQLANHVLQCAAQDSGQQASASTVFEHLNSFSVRAPSQFIDAIARSKDVMQVMTNEADSPSLVAPVSERSIEL
ncbi:MAG: hypothetical protein ABW202_12195 [Duganella sp.]